MRFIKGGSTIGPREKVRFAAKLAGKKKAEDAVILDLRKIANYCDYFLICSGNSQRQVLSIADEIEAGFLKKKIKAVKANAGRDGLWTLLDYGDLVIHVFHKDTRKYYDLERLWIDAPRVPISTD